MRSLIVGCGYVGIPLGQKLSEAGHTVAGLRRSAPAAEVPGIQWLQADITDPESLAQIEPAFDVVINVVSSSKGGEEDYRSVYWQGTRNLLAWLGTRPPAKYLYTSSTSVYAQNDGSVVTEESPANPDSATSRILVETENELLQASRTRGFPAVILRVAGIYGPERGHLFKQYLRGEAALRDSGESFINNVHLDDIVGAAAHLVTSGNPGEIYNVVDNEPITQREFFHWLSERLDKPMPPTAPGDPNRKRGLTNKRVSNAKLRRSGYSMIYPTFREGYAAEMERLGIS